MTTFDAQEPRSRLVVFRLTEREYLLMKKACSETRRSMSDFARSLVLASIDPAGDKAPQGNLQVMGEQISTLSADVEALKEAVSQLSTGRARKARPTVEFRSKERSHL